MTFRWVFKGTGAALFGRGVGAGIHEKVPGAVFLRQAHGNRVLISPKPMEEADGMVIPRTEGVFPGLRTADCLPVFAFWKGSLGCAHAGWRGLSTGILDELMLHGGGPPEAVVFGPCICGECYTAGEEVRSLFTRDDPLGNGKHPSGRVDLRGAAAEAFTGKSRVFSVDLCTLCSPGFHSYRRNRTSLRNTFWLAPEEAGYDIPNLISMEASEY
jgi:hypothetical protein